MQRGQRPEAIDTRLVFRVYAWCAIAAGAVAYGWPAARLPGVGTDLTGVPFGRIALVRVASTVVVVFGLVAAGFGAVADPVSRRRALYWFALAHFVAGTLISVQWLAVFQNVVSAWVVWAPLIVGAVLLYVAATAPTLAAPLRRAYTLLGPADRDPGHHLVVDTRLEAIDTLRSQYEEQIRQAARREERARLARDLHDAVKQQLFVIQTAAATAQARYETDEPGAKTALDQIRTSAREAAIEMEALIEELQAAPMGNAGLVDSLNKQCEALGFRTGADVTFDVGTLPPDETLRPGAHEILFRVAQEALANIGRHARAQHVTVALGLTGDRLELAIRDDGAGFDLHAARRGMGLRNMTARAGELAGTFSVNSSPGKGTLVRLSIPCGFESPREYARKALLWAAILALIAGGWLFRGGVDRPWHIAFAAIVAITAARYALAYRRVRRDRGAPA
jgi:signal transduction histidine kinase